MKKVRRSVGFIKEVVSDIYHDNGVFDALVALHRYRLFGYLSDDQFLQICEEIFS